MFNKLLGIFLLALSIQVSANQDIEKDVQCLAENIYFEARSQATAGWLGIAAVTINRVLLEKFPDSICGVVYQGPTLEGSNVPLKNKCQFSWYCNGVEEHIENLELFFQIIYFSKLMLGSQGAMFDVTDGATHYHNNSVRPYWARDMTRTVRINNHTFYRKD